MTVDCRLSLKEIASQLNTSETSLKELLLIERKLTPEVKQPLNLQCFIVKNCKLCYCVYKGA